MKLSLGFFKCFGFCSILCLILCLAQILMTGCGPQKAAIKDDKTNMQTITQNDTPFACNMSALKPEEKKRVLELLSELKTKKEEVKKLPDGFALRYPMDSGTFRDLAEFITYERLCCPFFNFELEVEKENGPLWLKLRGREGVKDFIKIEFDL